MAILSILRGISSSKVFLHGLSLQHGSWTSYMVASFQEWVGARICHPEIRHWHKDYFELEANENWQVQKDTFQELPLPDKKQKLLRNESCHNSPSQGSFMAMKKTESQHRYGPAETNLTPLASPTYLPSHSLSPLEA